MQNAKSSLKQADFEDIELVYADGIFISKIKSWKAAQQCQHELCEYYSGAEADFVCDLA